MNIIDLPPDSETLIRQTACILVDAFSEHWGESWPDVESAMKEVRECLDPGRINRIALAEDGRVLGWAGATNTYKPCGWELHPLAVAPAAQGHGVGRALMADLEQCVAAQGGLTIYLGSDDVDGMTSLSGVDLFDGYFEHLQNIRNIKGHPFEFYQKVGYRIIGAVPDANGWGKPDIWMAKSVNSTHK